MMQHMNSNGKTFLDNWVEERAVEEINLCKPGINMSANKLGHKGILTLDVDAKVEHSTTSLVSYQGRCGSKETQGRRLNNLKKELYREAESVMETKKKSDGVKPEYKSTTANDFPDISDAFSTVSRRSRAMQFDADVRANTFGGAKRSEEPAEISTSAADLLGDGITFWSENYRRSGPLTHGQTAGTEKAPFKKNTHFSKAIEERLF